MEQNNLAKLERNVDEILAELKSILLKKQQDYGPLNISLAPGGPFNGLRVRMYDKLARFSNLVDNNNDTPNYESLEDTFIDLANYAIIGILVHNGQWEGVPSQYARRQMNGASKNTNPERPANSVPRPYGNQRSPETYTGNTPNPIVVRWR
jgi:hypothetical protein